MSVYETEPTTSCRYMKQNLQLPVGIWKIVLTYYYRNKAEVDNI